MPKVVIDSDIIEQNLIPLTKNALSKMSDVVSSANGVYFPSDDFGWARTFNDLQDCQSDIRVFSTWLQNLNTSMRNSINNGLEDLEKLTLDEVTKKE